MTSMREKLRARVDVSRSVDGAALAREEAAANSASSFSPSPPPPVSMRAKMAFHTEQSLAEADPHAYSEVKRICDLPIIQRLEPEEVEEVSRRWLLAEAFNRGDRLFREQAEAILAWETWDRNFNPIGVGWGKGLIDLMLFEHSFRSGVARGVLFMPAQTFIGFTQHYIPWARKMIPISYPITEIGSKTARQRMVSATSGRRGLYLIPYSCLSTKDSEDILRAIAPGVVIADEGHYLKNHRAARARRVESMLYDSKDQRNDVRFVVLSGTITSKSVLDYHHLLRACLGRGCPLPLAPVMAGEWGHVVDSGSNPSSAMTGPIEPLVNWARRNFKGEEVPVGVAGFRKAYRLRLTSTPGVTASGDSELQCSLIFANQPVPEPEKRPGWEKLQDLLGRIDKEWVTPTGDEIEHEIHAFKWRYELNAGFYNELYWETPEHLAARRSVPLDIARANLESAREHHGYHQKYAKALREWLKDRARLHLDTPLLVGQSMSRHGAKEVGAPLYADWREMKDLEFDGMPERQSRAVRVCDWKVVHGLEWALSVVKDGEGGILWVYHQELGHWAAEILREALGPELVMHCPAGEAHDAAIQDLANARKIAVASISAHGTGKNLQHYQRQFALQWPRPADRAEQMIGRTHRPGQEADEIVFWRCDTSEFDKMLFAACAQDSCYIHQTTGSRQKLIYGTHEPVPEMFPSEVLRERGFQNKMLDGAAQRLMQERFVT